MNKEKHTDLLMIFVKNPRLGKVKTRLAKDVGDEKALDIYINLLCRHTRTVTDQIACTHQVGYTWEIEPADIWDGYDKFPQQGEGLGERMELAFQQAFSDGFQKVCIIGSDCLELRAEHLNTAFQALDHHDVVIGPAKDGGYYLLGMKRLHPSFFRNKQWSTETVLPDTLQDIQSLQLTVQQLETLSDVDTVKDLKGVEYQNTTF